MLISVLKTTKSNKEGFTVFRFMRHTRKRGFEEGISSSRLLRPTLSSISVAEEKKIAEEASRPWNPSGLD